MTDKTNHLRVLLQAGKPSLATRIWSTWPIVIEAAGSTGNYDYVEFGRRVHAVFPERP